MTTLLEYILTALFDSCYSEHGTQMREEKGNHSWQRPGEGRGRKAGGLPVVKDKGGDHL